MSTYAIYGEDDTLIAVVSSRREAERTARRILGVRRAYRSDPTPLDLSHDDDDGWRHAGREVGCGSVRILANRRTP